MTVREIWKLGDIAYFGKVSKLGEKNCLIRQKNTLLKITALGPTSSGSFEVVLLNKDESGKGQLFMRSLNSAV